jgi:hypothetical protein
MDVMVLKGSPFVNSIQVLSLTITVYRQFKQSHYPRPELRSETTTPQLCCIQRLYYFSMHHLNQTQHFKPITLFGGQLVITNKPINKLMGYKM